MDSLPRPDHEAERVRLLHELRILDTESETAFDAIARLASQRTGCSIGAVSLVDAERQWFKAAVGLDVRETARDSAFCARVVATSAVVVVGDALAQADFAANPLVSGMARIRFYAGAPIVVDQHCLGSVCCMERHPRTLDDAALRSLVDLATLASALLQARLRERHSRVQEARVRTASRAAKDWMWETDAEGRLTWLSDNLAQRDDQGPRHVIGEPWFAPYEMLAPLRPMERTRGSESFARREAFRDLLTDCAVSRGTITVSSSGEPVFDTAGRFMGFRGASRDVTAQRNAEAALRDKQAAELASRAKSEFLSRMSHEMRTPLNAVIGFSQLLLSRSDDPGTREVRDYAGHVLRAGEHLLALINDVLDLQRVEQGHVALELTDVPLDRIVVQVLDLLSSDAEQRGVAFDNHVRPGIAVRADERRLRQVLINIGSNAVKYNRPAGVVRWTVDAVSVPGTARLSVEDSGSGLGQEQLDRLFQPFERLGKETSTIEGTGLGLIIARSLATAMGGSLQIVSNSGVGTRVRVDLPLARHANVAAEPAPASPPPVPNRIVENSAGPLLRVLYVEDNRVNAILFEQAIRLRDGIELRLAEDGADALRQVRDWRPDVLVLDAHLPGMNGFELLQALRGGAGLTDVPAFMCSADAMPDDMKRAEDAGFTGYWAKPINIAKIMKDLDRLCAANSSV